ncbi:hypothetical protein SAMN05421855_101171 [Ulvibacter litoralis]|uniref:Uncharacterized protein n=1 Tax=Ulvibacter litoralis TaxID=227084 RepID=A0A1G7C3Z4_9FLAO|nr:hypothetical protein GCM10008083_10160 [Ulvibacter litoralis]SDE34082.1 hypothetical protein SAMN05421855_101171 [Ulvibacter litoralis]
MTPGIHPQIVKIKTITIDPHPLSKTAKGGNKIESNTLQILIVQIYKLKKTDPLIKYI